MNVNANSANSHGWKPEQEWYARCERRDTAKESGRVLSYYTYSTRETALDFALKVRNEWDTVEIGQRDKCRIKKPSVPYWWPKPKKSNKQAQKNTLCIPGVESMENRRQRSDFKAEWSNAHRVRHEAFSYKVGGRDTDEETIVIGVVVDIQKSNHKRPRYSYSVGFYRDSQSQGEKTMRHCSVFVDRDTGSVRSLRSAIGAAVEEAETWIEQMTARDARAA